MEKAKQFPPLLVACCVLAALFSVFEVMGAIPEQFTIAYWALFIGGCLILYLDPAENARTAIKGIWGTILLGGIWMAIDIIYSLATHPELPLSESLAQHPSAIFDLAICPYGTMICVAGYVQVKFRDRLSKK